MLQTQINQICRTTRCLHCYASARHYTLIATSGDVSFFFSFFVDKIIVEENFARMGKKN